MKKMIAFMLALSFTQGLFAQETIEIKIDKLIEAYTEVGKFNGSALVAWHDKIILEKGYGYRSFKDSLPNDTNTIFQIASVTKQFTSAVILRLVELKKLSLTDRLSKFYPDFPKGDSITIENLLNHTSGIFEWTDEPNFANTGEKSLVAMLETKNLYFPPGTNWRYSNSNYSLLGYIIPKVSGLSYEQAVSTYIFKPLQMTHSGFDFKHLANKEKSTGYATFSDSAKMEGTLYDRIGPFAAGEIYSTVGDLYKWHEGLQSNKVIRRTSLEKAFQPFKKHYGYGWIVDSLFGKRVTSHSGDISGFSSNLARITEDDVFIVLLNNKQGGSLEKITKDVFAILYNQPYTTPKKRHPIKLERAILEKYIGSYEVITPHGSVFGDVTIENGKLILQPNGRPKLELIAEKVNHFYDEFEGTEGDVEFGTDDNGNVDKIILSQNGVFISGKKIK